MDSKSYLQYPQKQEDYYKSYKKDIKSNKKRLHQVQALTILRKTKQLYQKERFGLKIKYKDLLLINPTHLVQESIQYHHKNQLKPHKQHLFSSLTQSDLFSTLLYMVVKLK